MILGEFISWQNMKPKKIAFIYYPYKPNATRLETMSFALNAVVFLGKMGWNIDLYLWEEPSSIYGDILPETVSIKYLKDLRISPSSRLTQPRISPTLLHIKWLENYYCVFGVSPIGAYIGSILAKFCRCEFIYFSDEMPSCWDPFPPNSSRELLQIALNNTDMVVVPDASRFAPLCEDIEVRTNNYASLPNIPMIKFPLQEINWHERLGIPQNTTPFLCAGTIADWIQTPELLSILPYCPENVVLILNSINSQEMEKYRNSLAHLDLSGRIFWNLNPLSVDELHSLVAYCAGNFALYRDTGSNTKHMGFASGKLMRSIVCGAPVIASKGFYCSFVEDYQLGVLVNHPVEIPEAVNKVIENRNKYSENCLAFAQKFSFENAWNKFCGDLKEKLGVDLWQATT